MTLQDIGVPRGLGGSLRGVAISPDGRSVALELRKPDLAENKTILRWVVISLEDRNTAADVGDGGEPVENLTPDGLAAGHLPAQLPQWSEDSEWIYYTARHDRETQLWRSRRDGSAQERLTRSESDVKAFQVLHEGRDVVLQLGPKRERVQNLLQQEAGRGFLYDERFSPAYSRELLPIAARPPYSDRSIRLLDLNSGVLKRPSSDEREQFEKLLADAAVQIPGAANRHDRQQGHRVWLDDLRPNRDRDFNPPLTVVAQAGSAPRSCPAPVCTGRHTGVWTDEKVENVYFLRWDGAYDYGPMSLYSWKVSGNQVRRIVRTDAYITGCSYTKETLVCGYQTATTPNKLVRIDLRSGRVATLFDPNPNFQSIRLGQVESLSWKSPEGVEGFGHLVMPTKHRPGQKFPLIVVQYRSRGFLRGGVGDEFPIQMFASKGFAVLSFHRPDDWELQERSVSAMEAYVAGFDGLRDRRRVHSSLVAGIELLIRRGIVDPERIALTGLSDGAETAAYFLIHPPFHVAAAALSQTFWSPLTYYLLGPEFQKQMRSFGMGDPNAEAPRAKWSQLSVAMNAEKIDVPLLLQAADSEFLPETHVYAEMRAAAKPVEMYVFPNESHIKVQPSHRYSVYKRSVQWFQFWLLDIEEIDPLDPEQYVRWRRLRSEGLARN